MTPQILTWIQAVAYLVSIVGTVAAAWFAVFVIWPSIRRQNKMAERIERLAGHLERKGTDDLLSGL